MVDVRGTVHSGSGQSRSGRDNFRGLAITPNGAAFTSDYLHMLAREGRIFGAGDSTLVATITGRTSIATTTPDLLLTVPDATIAIPLYLQLTQTGTVAGGEITIHLEYDNADRYSSGGTTETVLSTRTDNPVSNACTLRSSSGTAITATDAYGMGLWHGEFIQDVDPAVADDFKWHNWDWSPPVPVYLVGPASFLVYTAAATTGPTFYWNFFWAEIPESELN